MASTSRRARPKLFLLVASIGPLLVLTACAAPAPSSEEVEVTHAKETATVVLYVEGMT